MSKKILLIDGNSMANRAFYATMGRMMKTPTGISTNAVYGFFQIMFKTIEEEKPDKIIVAFDISSSEKRTKIFSEYKAGRHKAPEDLTIQFPIIKELLKTMNIPIVQKDGIEADDILGAIAKKEGKKGNKIIILTGDRDYFQLVDINVNIRYPKTIMGKTEYIIYDNYKINEEYGLTPEKLIEVKALMGDASDNIPGVKGIGEKTALKLIIQFESLEKIYEYIENSDGKEIAKATLNKLIQDKEMAYISRDLGRIDIEYDYEKDLGINIDSIRYTDWRTEEAYSYFKKISFNKFLDKFKDIEIKKAEDTNKIEKNENYSIEDILKTDVKSKKKEDAILSSRNENKKEKEILEDKIKKIREDIKLDLEIYSYDETKKEEILEKLKQCIKDVDKYGNRIYVYNNSKEKIGIKDYDNRENSNEDIVDKYIKKYILKEDFLENIIQEEYKNRVTKEISENITIMFVDKNNSKGYIYTLSIDDKIIQDIFKNEKIEKVSHGIKEGIVEILEKGKDFKNLIFDTKIASYILNSEIRTIWIKTNIFKRNRRRL
jgi:DNA-directed DNA polymerase